MDRRLLLALLLTTVVVLAVPRLFPTPQQATRPVAARAGDSTRAGTTATTPAATPPAMQPTAAAPAGDTTAGTAAALPAAKPDTVTVATPHVVYTFSTVGAHPIQARLTSYESLRDKSQRVSLARDGVPLLRFRLAAGGDTVALDRMPFAVDSSAPATAGGLPGPLTFRAPIGPSGEATIRYDFTDDGYLTRVSGEVTGYPNAQLLINMPDGLRSEEVDSLDDIRHLAYVAKPVRDAARSIPFAKTDTALAQTETDGPYTWVASKNKYFLLAVIAPDSSQTLSSLRLTPTVRGKKALAKDVAATISRPLGPDGRFAFELYAGPQEWRRLNALGRDLVDVNTYGWTFMKGIIQPFGLAMMRLLLWMHDSLKISYGWVLIIFGIAVRLILWPLNQSAMRNQLKMQAIQPELQALQKKYMSDPQKQQAEVMALYKRHGMSPFSPLMGCVPMLIPMPFLIALFFVFQSTIEFRGVPFLWLADISQKDPYYILPILMGLSMYLLSWIGMRNQPPNPQAKMLAYLMPAMMTFFLLNLAAGLNLYYAVQNIAAMPQQWLIARERAKSGAGSAVVAKAT
ncbi:MAG TPA: membrane protein insertase YidC [Gemmatimonadaceae bacterium]|nr:membrane protein insertase YidC [Gemmatimonadaceae bacterium]